MRLLIIALLLLFTFTASAQKAIHWRTGKCLVVDIEQAETQCEDYVQDNDDVHIIKYKNIVVAAVMFYTDSHFGINVAVQNNGDEKILVDRDSPRMGIFFTENMSDKPKELIPIPPEKIAKGIQNRIFWANALGSLGAGVQTKTSNSDVTITDNQGNTTTGTVTTTEPDKNAQRQQSKVNTQNTQKADSQASSVLSTALKSNTLFKSQTTYGIVYFKRNKKTKVGVFAIPINGVTFFFPMRYAIK